MQFPKYVVLTARHFLTMATTNYAVYIIDIVELDDGFDDFLDVSVFSKSRGLLLIWFSDIAVIIWDASILH